MAQNKLGIESNVAGEYPKRHNAREIKLLETLRYETNLVENFDSPLILGANNLSTGLLLDSTLAAGDEIAGATRRGSYTFHVQSINGTVVNTFPVVTASGLELKVTGSATNGVLGWEMVPGHQFASSAHGETIGSFNDPAKRIYFEAVLNAATIARVNEWAVGFRNDGAFEADMDDYTDCASLRIDSSADVQISTILNNAATSDIDTTINAADATDITLRVEVDNDGKAYFFVNGTEREEATFTFDSTDDIVPFIYLITDTDDPVAIVKSFELGYK